MTPTEKTVIGLAKQVAKGTPNDTDASFKYLLFSRGSVAPSSVVLPLDPEVGGGPMIRDMVKVGVMSGGALEFIPRPDTLGLLLLGLLGKDTPVQHPTTTTGYDHVFEHDMDDQFATPYFTVRSAPGYMWGESMQDMKVSSLALRWDAANFVRGQVGFAGGMPTKVATTTWEPTLKVDNGPQFLTPIVGIELPDATPVKCLSGAFTAGAAVPLDQQWVVGSYTPDDFDIVSRAYAISMVLKITDGTLYSKMMYDPSGGSTWVADLMKEGNFKLSFQSNVKVETTHPYELTIQGNEGAAALGNVAWSASPIGIRAGQQVVMNVTGVFLADPTTPIKILLTNTTASY